MCRKNFTNANRDIQRQLLINTRVFVRPNEHLATDGCKQISDFDYKYQEKFKRPPVPPPPEYLTGKFRITQYALSGIEYLIGTKPAESGGMLLSESHDFTVTGFIFDNFGSNNGSAYHPNAGYLN